MILVRIHQYFCNSVVVSPVTKVTNATKASITFIFSASIFNHYLFQAISTSFIHYSGFDKIDQQYYTVANCNDCLF